MQGYRVYFDGEKFVVESELSEVGQTPYDSPIYWCSNPELAWIEASNRNIAIRTGAWEIRTCKDCGKYFILSHPEMEWFTMHGMKSPRRCMACRKERKNEQRRG